ncbi:hypothetical protein [Candidatus Villigracilis affinis]|uniref:hypothetical protein n=1 Tax=Candidatus Villigracilis affinis TaxID=3140682 RepID=UPI002A1C4E5F|nr:hypothetical protein [Anaerolineales bacterium]
MFDNKEKQLADLETAYASFIDTLTGLASEDILKSLGDWTPRDIAAHFIGWNRITLAGCSTLREGAEPFIFTMAQMTTEKSMRNLSPNSPPPIRANC